MEESTFEEEPAVRCTGKPKCNKVACRCAVCFLWRCNVKASARSVRSPRQ